MPSPSCMVLHCTDRRSDPNHEVSTPEDDAGWHRTPVCAEHWSRIDADESWLWVPGRRLKGVGSTMSEGCILMGDELAGYGLVVDRTRKPALNGGMDAVLVVEPICDTVSARRS